MFVSHLRVAFRNLARNKLYSVINIGGLAVGLAICMTILIYVVHEHSYDRFHQDANKIFLLECTETHDGQPQDAVFMNHIDAPMLQQFSPQVENYLRIHVLYNAVLSLPSGGSAHYKEQRNFILADSNFFNFLSFRLLRGNLSTALSEPNDVVLSLSAAKKYFGEQDPIGKSILYDSTLLFKVTGICEDPPSNSSIFYSFIAPISALSHTQDSSQLRLNWFGVGNFLTLLKLGDTTTIKNVEGTATRLAAFDRTGVSKGLVFKLARLIDNHLSATPIGGRGNTRFLSLFTLVAGLILLLALINYMSLATARAVTRSREVGVRKVIGADRYSIAAQFFIESALSAALAFLIGGALFLALRDVFFKIIGLDVDISFLKLPIVLFSFLGLLLTTIVVAGSYPSLVLSAYNPVTVLYGRLSRQRGGAIIRKSFTVLQFAISITLVTCTLFIGKQLKYMRQADTGLDRNNVLMIPYGKTLKGYEAFKREVATIPSVQLTATANYSLYKGVFTRLYKKSSSGYQIPMSYMIVDTGFIRLMGLKWKEKPASMAAVMDGRHPMLNEVAVARLGLAGRATGQILDDSSVVGGVVQNFNYVSLAREIEPLQLYIGLDTSAFGRQNNVLFVKLQPYCDVAETLKKIGAVYASFDKSSQFSYEFLDEVYDSQYKTEERLADLMSAFSTIAVIIACLGLFALATFSAQQGAKEISIRKVLGAPAMGVATSLSFNFLKPVTLSLLIGLPLSAWLMVGWLNKFAYRIALSWGVFTLASGIMVLLALATVFFLSVRAALANPANVLRQD